jgi:hypothetical protein
LKDLSFAIVVTTSVVRFATIFIIAGADFLVFAIGLIAFLVAAFFTTFFAFGAGFFFTTFFFVVAIRSSLLLVSGSRFQVSGENRLIYKSENQKGGPQATDPVSRNFV